MKKRSYEEIIAYTFPDGETFTIPVNNYTAIYSYDASRENPYFDTGEKTDDLKLINSYVTPEMNLCQFIADCQAGVADWESVGSSQSSGFYADTTTIPRDLCQVENMKLNLENTLTDNPWLLDYFGVTKNEFIKLDSKFILEALDFLQNPEKLESAKKEAEKNAQKLPTS